MKYYLVEGKFKTFNFSLYDDENKALKKEFHDFLQAGMDRGIFSCSAIRPTAFSAWLEAIT